MAIFSAFRKRQKTNQILKGDVSITSDISFYGYRPALSSNYFTEAYLQSITFNCLMKIYIPMETSVYKGYKQDKIEMRGDRAEMSDFPLYLNTVAGGLDRRDQAIGGFSFVVKIYAVPVVEIIG